MGLEPEDGEDPGDVKTLETLAVLYARFLKVTTDPGEVDQKFEEMQDALENAKEAQSLVDIASQQVHFSDQKYHTLSRDYEVAETTETRGWAVLAHWLEVRPRRRLRCPRGTTGMVTN